MRNFADQICAADTFDVDEDDVEPDVDDDGDDDEDLDDGDDDEDE